jgi:chemotaxis protein MotB
MVSTPTVARPQAEETESVEPDSDDPENIESRTGSDEDEEGTITSEQLEQLLQQQEVANEAAQFAEAEKLIRKAIDDSDDEELKEAAEGMQIESSKEGLRIQLLDQEKVALFPLGSDEMNERTRKLLEKVAEIIKKLPNKIKISGHTDATPFAPGSLRTNWDLSTERANASRRVLGEFGVGEERIAQIVGMADKDPIEPDNPLAPANRRISIVLLSETKKTGDEPPTDETATATETSLPALKKQKETPLIKPSAKTDS